MLCAFDFDGTIADSRSVYYKAIDVYSRRNGFKVPQQSEMDLVFGNPTPPIVFETWGPKENFVGHLEQVYAMTDDLICEQPSIMPLFVGIREQLVELHKHFVLAIVTSRSLKPVQALIHHHKIETYFRTIRSDQDIIDRGYRGKPHHDKLNCVLRELACPTEKAVMIGDTLMDMSMARNAGTKALGVSWGFHDEATLREHGADDIVESPEKLNQAIYKLLSGVEG
jgi:phosphoglycolate phosphatase